MIQLSEFRYLLHTAGLARRRGLLFQAVVVATVVVVVVVVIVVVVVVVVVVAVCFTSEYSSTRKACGTVTTEALAWG